MSGTTTWGGTTGDRPPRVSTTAIDRFARRARALRIARGLAVAAVVAAVGLVAAAAYDHWGHPSPSQRTAAAVALYGATIVAGWLATRDRAARRWASPGHGREHSGSADLLWAHRFESAEASVRGDLSASVDLDHRPAGSPSLRDTLHRRVGDTVAAVSIGRLLPLRLIAVPLAAAALAVALVGLSTAVPGLQSPRRIARVLLPVANIERASTVQIQIRRPDPPDRNVAVADFVVVAADVTFAGDPAPEVTIEWRDEDGRRGREPMSIAGDPDGDSPGTPIAFAGTLPAGAAPLRYRLLAGDAETRWHTLTPVARPQLVQIDVTVDPPPYAGVESTSRTLMPADPGAAGPVPLWRIEAITGSRAVVTATFDQPVTTASATFSDGLSTRGPTDLSGQSVDPSRHRWTVPIDRDGEFRLAATSAVTSLDNPFLTPVTIVATADAPPTVRWQQPDVAMAIVSPDASLDWSGEVGDEFPIDLVAQQILQPAGGVVERPLSVSLPPSTTGDNQRFLTSVPVDWDLANPLAGVVPPDPAVRFDPGSRLRTRLMAVDRLGQRSYSGWVDVLIAGRNVDPRRYESPGQVAAAVARLSTWMADMIAQCDLRRKQYEKPPNEVDHDPTRIDAAEMIARWETIRGPIDSPPRDDQPPTLATLLAGEDPVWGDQAALLIRLGQAAAAELQSVDEAARRWTGDGPLAPVAAAADARRMLVGRAVDARRLAEAGRAMAPAMIQLAVGRVLQADLLATIASIEPLVGDDAVFIHDDGTGLIELAMAQMDQVEMLVDPFSSAIGEKGAELHQTLWRSVHDASRRAGEVAHQWRTQPDVNRADGIEKLRGVIATLQHSATHQAFESRSAGALVEAQRADPMGARAVGAAIQRPGSVIDRKVRAAKSDAAGDLNLTPPLSELYAMSIEDLVAKFRLAARIVRLRSGSIVDAADSDLLAAVAEHLRRDTSVDEFDPRWTTFSTAATGLIAADDVLDATAGLTRLAAAERYDRDVTNARVRHPIALDRIATSLVQSVPVLQDNDLGWETVRPIADARYGPAMTQATDWITRRRWSPDPPISAAAPLDEVAAIYREAIPIVTDRAVRARQSLRGMLPPVEQLAKTAADDVAAADSDDNRTLPPSVERLTERLLNESESAPENFPRNRPSGRRRRGGAGRTDACDRRGPVRHACRSAAGDAKTRRNVAASRRAGRRGDGFRSRRIDPPATRRVGGGNPGPIADRATRPAAVATADGPRRGHAGGDAAAGRRRGRRCGRRVSRFSRTGRVVA